MKVGLTTTIPVEILFAAGVTPVDMNNLFITGDKSHKYVEYAEMTGFPRNLCAWIKGIYGVAIEEKIDAIIGVTEGDCSNTKALMEVWASNGLKIIPFGYPKTRSYEKIKKEMDQLMDYFNVDLQQVETIKKALFPIREKVKQIDQLTWKDNLVSGFENHLYLVSCSDFYGDYKEFEKELDGKINEIKNRSPYPSHEVRLGYMGVPPINGDIYSLIEASGGRVVYNEVQKSFSMAYEDINTDIYQMYINYSYPYDLNYRLMDVKMAIDERKLDGIIHYTQSFCHRGIEDILVKKNLKIPVLTIEGDMPGDTDSRTKLRLESFMDMLKDLKE